MFVSMGFILCRLAECIYAMQNGINNILVLWGVVVLWAYYFSYGAKGQGIKSCGGCKIIYVFICSVKRLY